MLRKMSSLKLKCIQMHKVANNQIASLLEENILIHWIERRKKA